MCLKVLDIKNLGLGDKSGWKRWFEVLNALCLPIPITTVLQKIPWGAFNKRRPYCFVVELHFATV